MQESKTFEQFEPIIEQIFLVDCDLQLYDVRTSSDFLVEIGVLVLSEKRVIGSGERKRNNRIF